jgi:hypothetical protein
MSLESDIGANDWVGCDSWIGANEARNLFRFNRRLSGAFRHANTPGFSALKRNEFRAPQGTHTSLIVGMN